MDIPSECHDKECHKLPVIRKSKNPFLRKPPNSVIAKFSEDNIITECLDGNNLGNFTKSSKKVTNYRNS